jgi:eukaryotic-like serine/threonine-protein kinase
MIGEQVGSYRIESLLGQGGMGAVYRAKHVSLGRPAAIKILLPQFTATPDIVRRFFNEAKASTSIRHLGIVEIYDFGQMDNGMAFIAMELLRGESLADRMKTTRMSAGQALGIMRQMSGALGAAHQAGIVHRDLKPDNVFIVPDAEVASGERVKILDFGIAKLSEESMGMSSQTRTGSLMGTPTYMSPEQCRGVKVDLRSDIYAMGCILYEIIAGRTPFIGEGVGDILGAHIYEKHVPLATVVPGGLHSVSDLVDAMMAKDPAQRPQTTAVVISMIDQVLAGSGTNTAPTLGQLLPGRAAGTAASAPTTLSASVAIGSPTRTNNRRPAMMAGLLLAAGGGTFAYLQRASRPASLSAAPATASVVLPPATPATALEKPALTEKPAPTPAPEVRSTNIKIVSKPAGAEVIFADTIKGVTPFVAIWQQSAPRMAISVRKAGFATKVIDADASHDIDENITLTRLETKRAPVTSKPAATNAAKPPAADSDDDHIRNPLKRP